MFEANLTTGELWKQGRKIKLQSQPFQVLNLLLHQPGSLVSREDLQRAIWPDAAHGDFDQGVNTAIRKIRQALDDTADRPRFIETLPRKGYRFIAPVTHSVAEAQPIQPAKRSLPLFAIGAAIAALVSGVVFLGVTARRNPTVVSPVAVPLTTYRGIEREPSFSPDGGRVAFIWNGVNEDNFDVYVKAVGQEKYDRLTHDSRPDFAPAWSPDGKLIAFGRILSATRVGIFVVPAAGGPEAKILEQPRHVTETPYFPFVSWSPDGKWLAVSDIITGEDAGKSQYRLFLVSVETGERRQLTPSTLDSRADYAPTFFADGRSLAFFTHGPGHHVRVLPLTPDLRPAGPPRQIGSKTRALSLAWIPQREELLLSSAIEYGHASEFWILDVERGGIRRAPFQTRYSDSIALSRRGQVAYTQISADRNIWKLELDASGNAIGLPHPFIASTRDDQNPKYSPDGKQLVFTSNRSGTLEVWVCQSDGSNPRQLTAMGQGTTGAPRWSPDGSRIIFDSNSSGSFQLYSILAAGGSPQLLTKPAVANALGSISRDGQTIYYMSDRGGGPEIWRMPTSGGAPSRITKAGGRYAIESLDSRFLYYSKEGTRGEANGNRGIWRIPVGGGDEVRVLPTVTFQNFSLTRSGIFHIPEAQTKDDAPTFSYTGGADGLYSIHYSPLDTAITRRVIQISGRPSTGMAVSPDGRTLLWTQTDQVGSDLMLLPSVP